MEPLVDQAADGVWLVSGTDVNWVLVADEDGVTLVDTGEPRDLWRPQVLMWAVRITRAGATRVERLTEVTPFEAGSGPLDVPGRLVPVPTPGHTSGHCAFHLPDRGVLIAGDALITAHPVARTSGPQLCPRMFNYDEAATVDSLQALAAVSADVVLTGHGPPYRGSPASAVEIALAAR